MFNPIYSSYYLVIKNIIAEYIINNKNPLTNEQITQIVSKTAYIEAPGELYDLINNTSEEGAVPKERGSLHYFKDKQVQKW